MRIFVTGASGHIGLPTVRELIAAGHSVVGLARSDESAAKIQAAGAEVRRGTLDDLEGLRDAARAADGVVHLGFKHDVAFSGDFMGAVKADLDAVRAIGEALVGSDKPFANTTGTMLLAHSVRARTGTEDDAGVAGGNPRTASEDLSLAFATQGVRTSIVRLSPTVHSSLDHHGFIPILIGAARKNGFALYVEDGANRWPAVHTLDAARLYRLAVEKAPPGARLHAVDDEGVAFKAIAEAIAKGAGVPAKRVTPDEAKELLGEFMAWAVQSDNPTSSAKTRALVDWNPAHAQLLPDLAEGHYFK
ncbi:MAG: SDR family oxidoreductase [Kofleriaceae bacterium]